MNAEQAKTLRAPFPAEAIGKLPKGGAQLDYVGHAAVTDRLLAVDPGWFWEPVAWAEDGGPLIRYGTKEASLWIRLTVCDVTRIGVGICPVAAFELEKQLVSDALRNAAMRFGVALDLWSRQPLLDDVGTPGTASKPSRSKPSKPAAPAPAAPDPSDPEVLVDQELIDSVKAAVAALDDHARGEFDRWKRSRRFAWPWSIDDCVTMLTRLSIVPNPSDPMEEPF